MDKTHNKAILNHALWWSYKDHSKLPHYTYWDLSVIFIFVWKRQRKKNSKSTKQLVIRKKQKHWVNRSSGFGYDLSFRNHSHCKKLNNLRKTGHLENNSSIFLLCQKSVFRNFLRSRLINCYWLNDFLKTSLITEFVLYYAMLSKQNNILQKTCNYNQNI